MRVAPIEHRWWHGERLSTYDPVSVGRSQVDWSTEPHGSVGVIFSFFSIMMIIMFYKLIIRH